jgi:hypothetical protein
MDAETLEILIFQWLRKTVSRPEVFGWNVVISPDPLSPTPSTSSAMNISGPSVSLVETAETPENKIRIPNTPEPAAEGDIQMEYSSY